MKSGIVCYNLQTTLCLSLEYVIIIQSYFHLASGLKVNYQKRKIIRIGTDKLQLLRYVTVLKCNIMITTFNYLGVNIEGNHWKKDFLEVMVAKIWKILSRWKGNSYP